MNRMNEEEMLESIRQFQAYIDEEVEKHLLGDYSKLFIGGFSQGCAITQLTALLCE